MTYTPGYVSDFLNVPGSTLRRWAVRFEKYLSPQPPEAGRHRVYSAQDLETFRTIRDLTAKGQGLKTIETILQTLPPGVFASDHEEPASPKQDQAAQGEPGPGSALMVMGFSRELGNHDAQLKALQDQINLQNDRLAALTEYLALPWYKRIGKRPPIKY